MSLLTRNAPRTVALSPASWRTRAAPARLCLSACTGPGQSRSASALILVLCLARLHAQTELTFPLDGRDAILADVTAEVGVRFRSMRFNPALNQWNLDVCLTNKSCRTIPGPLVLLFGLEPIERLRSDAAGRFTSLEPAEGKRLPGLTGAGQFVLVTVAVAQGVVSGTARDTAGRAVAGLPVRIAGQPWLTYSASDGAYRLVAPAGNQTVELTDPATGDHGQVMVTVPGGGAVGANPGAIPTGPRVVSITPPNGASRVARVSPIVITFSEPIHPGSLGAQGAQILDASGGVVAASVSLNLPNTVLTLLPVAQLAANTAYTVSLSATLADPAGLKLEGPRQFSFTTESDALDRVGAQVVSYEPVNGQAAMTGSPGTAEPESPVILVNETTGQTATILSKPDGSFTNSIAADVDDLLSAVLVNGNGTRNTIPVSYQIYRDGSVGVFRQGGSVQEMTEDGPIQVLIEPGAIPNKSRFKLHAMGPVEIGAVVGTNTPSEGKVLGAVRLGYSGDRPLESLDVVFPISRARLGLPPDVRPEDASYVLAAPTWVDGVLAYHLIDKMEYEHGALVTHSPPFVGAALAVLGAVWDAAGANGHVFGRPTTGIEAMQELMLTPLLIANRRAFTIHGVVGIGAAQPPANAAGRTEAVVSLARVLPGAIVTAMRSEAIGYSTGGRQGRLRPGEIYSIADHNGQYALRVGIVESGGFLLTAMHPALPRQRQIVVPNFQGNLSGTRADILFESPAAHLSDLSPPRLTVSHTPFLPPIPGTSRLNVLALDDESAPTLRATVASVLNLRSTDPIEDGVIQLLSVSQSQVGSSGIRQVYSVTCTTNVPVRVVLDLEATDASGNTATRRHPMDFGGSPMAGTNALQAPDRNDRVGPTVVFTWPSQDAAGWPAALPIRIRFNEAIDRSVLDRPADILISPATSRPSLSLSEDQTELTLSVADFEPGRTYAVTLSPVILDLRGNRLDQDPSVPGDDGFTLRFTTAAQRSGALPGIEFGGGALLRGGYAYALERTGPTDGALIVFDASNPLAPERVASLNLPSYPRDLVLIPSYSFRRRTDQPTETKDLLAIVGGQVGGDPMSLEPDAAASAGGPWLWIVDIGDPQTPRRVASALLTLDSLAAATKLAWSAPILAYLENSADVSSIGLIDLQTFIVSEYLTRAEYAALPFDGRAGHDANGDGDYTDEEDDLPMPPRRGGSFGGKLLSLTLPDSQQFIADFALGRGGALVSVVLRPGVLRDESGRPTTNVVAAAYRTLVNGDYLERDLSSVSFTNGTPVRVSHLLDASVGVSNEVSQLDLALVSVRSDGTTPHWLSVIDITDPTAPRELSRIGVSALPYSAVRREDGLVAVAVGDDLVLLDAAKLGHPGPPDGQPHPALVGRVPRSGSGARSVSSQPAGVAAVNAGGRHHLVQTAPALQFVSFTNVVVPQALVDDSPAVDGLLATMRVESNLRAARFRTAGGVSSTLSPPQPEAHYYVLVHAPGGAGPALEVGVESLNASGHPFKNKGRGFPPVRAVSRATSVRLGQLERPGCDATIRPLTAYRLSGDKASPHYNLYLSKPLCLSYETLEETHLVTLRAELDREVLWSGHYLRAFLDPMLETNPVVGPFAASLDVSTGTLGPGPAVVAETLPGTYIMGPNPAGIAGPIEVPGTLGTISAHNGEFRHDTEDLALPGRRMPIVFERSIGGQDLYDGPFGRGWDFNYNEHLTEFRPAVFAASSRKPLVIRSDTDANSVVGVSDVELHTGRGRVLLFRSGGASTPPEIAADPLVAELGWNVPGNRFFVPEPGCFDILCRFADGQFARLTPDGRQHWYDRTGRLERINDRFTRNQHALAYSERGELVRVCDLAIEDGSRILELGYWRYPRDPLFRLGLDEATTRPFVAGKVRRLRDHAGRDVLFNYTEDGILESKEGPLLAGANGGFAGRPRTTYLWTDDCQKVPLGIVAGNRSAQSGTPLFVAASQSGGVVSSGSGAMGRVTLTGPLRNTAADIENAVMTALGPHMESTRFTFDRYGQVKEFVLSGTNGLPSTNQLTVNSLGLLEKLTFPEGNYVLYQYDTNNPSLRSRANLMREEHFPGPRGADQESRVAIHRYEGRYNLLSGIQSDFNGNSPTYTLTPDGRAIDTIAHGSAGAYRFEVNEFGQIERARTPQGTETRLSYDPASGFKTRETRDSIVVQYDYDGTTAGQLGVPTRVVLPVGAPISAEYDSRLMLTGLRRGPFEESRAYDENGNLTRLSRTLGDGQQYEEARAYNQIGFLESITIADVATGTNRVALTTTFTPDAAWRVRKIVYPGGEERELTYDHFGNVQRMQIGGVAGYFEEYARDAHGNVVAFSQKGTLTRRIVHDGFDRVRAIVNTGSRGEEMTRTEYYPNGEVRSVSVRDPVDGVIQEIAVVERDALGRPTEVRRQGSDGTPAAIARVSYAGDPERRVTITGPRDSVTRTHDAAGRLRSVVNSAAAVTITPDENGNIVGLSSVEGTVAYELRMAYNPLDFLTNRSDPVGLQTAYAPRADGHATRITDGRGNETAQEFSVLGELLATRRDPSVGIELRRQYNPNRQPAFVGDKLLAGHSLSYTDGTMRLTGKSLRNGAAWAFEDPTGLNLPGKITIPGGVITREYDLQGRLVAQRIAYGADGDYEMTVVPDALGRPRRVTYGTEGRYAATFTYDRLGPMVSATYAGTMGTFTVRVEELYADGLRHRWRYPSLAAVTEHRQPSGRLEALAVDETDVWRVHEFAGVSQPGRADLGPNAIREINRYDARRRLVARRFERISDRAILADLRYKYDLADNIVVRQELHRHGRADLYEYDAANRLIRADSGARPQVIPAARENSSGLMAREGFASGHYARAYRFDSSGFDLLVGSVSVNPSSPWVGPLPPFAQSLTNHDGFLRARSIDGFDRGEPDPLGNTARTRLAVRPAGASEPVLMAANRLVYDGMSHLVRLEREDGILVRYEYQPDGLLHHRVVSSNGVVVSDTAMVWDQNRLIEEYQRDPSAPGTRLRARYYYADEDSPIAADIADAGGVLRRYYFLKDALSSVVAVADATGTVVERVRYDPWGQPVIEARDAQPPQVAAIYQTGSDELSLVFTESVMPPLARTEAGFELETATTDTLPGGVTLAHRGSAIPTASVTYVEDAREGSRFGSVVRVRASRALAGEVEVGVNGFVVDEWGLTNVPETIAVTVGAPGVLYQGSTSDTAPRRVARSETGSVLLFHGQYFDYDAGLLYLRARFYDPYAGQFLQPDPREYDDGVNLYAAFAHNPVSRRDPDGTSSFTVAKARAWLRTSSARTTARFDQILLRGKSPVSDVLRRVFQSRYMQVRAKADADRIAALPVEHRLTHATDEFIQRTLITELPLDPTLAQLAASDWAKTQRLRVAANKGAAWNMPFDDQGASFFNPAVQAESTLVQGFASRPRTQGVFDVGIHGERSGKVAVRLGPGETSRDWAEIDIGQVVEHMLVSGYAGQDIRLWACYGGFSETGIAAKLAAVFDVQLMAGTGRTWAYAFGEAANSGTWTVFSGGRRGPLYR